MIDVNDTIIPVNPIANTSAIPRDGAVDININEKPDAVPGVFEMKENGATYGVGADGLKGVRRFFSRFLKSKNSPIPTLLLWYKGLSRDEKKDVMVISKERTEDDSVSGK
jgi:hypothetical protein